MILISSIFLFYNPPPPKFNPVYATGYIIFILTTCKHFNYLVLVHKITVAKQISRLVTFVEHLIPKYKNLKSYF